VFQLFLDRPFPSFPGPFPLPFPPRFFPLFPPFPKSFPSLFSFPLSLPFLPFSLISALSTLSLSPTLLTPVPSFSSLSLPFLQSFCLLLLLKLLNITKMFLWNMHFKCKHGTKSETTYISKNHFATKMFIN
jgi:hypothetical protein